MVIRRAVYAALLACTFAGWAHNQDNAPPPAPSSDAPRLQTTALTVPKGTPIQIVLEKEVRVRRVGQPIQGRVVQPLYAFDRLVVPTGTEVTGQITKIDHISFKRHS